LGRVSVIIVVSVKNLHKRTRKNRTKNAEIIVGGRLRSVAKRAVGFGQVCQCGVFLTILIACNVKYSLFEERKVASNYEKGPADEFSFSKMLQI
ncbi:MAG: hypothetical protein ACI89U_002600, partial [Gammaproteobacteria bacterium]